MPLNDAIDETGIAPSDHSKTYPGYTEDALPRSFVPAVVAIWHQTKRQHWVQTRGTSMLPLIREGDRLLLSHNLASIYRGSIVVFWQNEQLIAHRVIRIVADSPARFVTKGDNSWTFDAPVTTHDLLGHVLVVQRQGHLITLDTVKWRMISRLIATMTLAIAVPYDWLRRIKARLWYDTPMPGARIIRQCSQALLTMMLKLALRLFVHS